MSLQSPNIPSKVDPKILEQLPQAKPVITLGDLRKALSRLSPDIFVHSIYIWQDLRKIEIYYKIDEFCNGKVERVQL